MAKQKDYRFRINTGWRMNTERAAIFSDARTHYGTQFTSKCIYVLHYVLKPLSLAVRCKSHSEVLVAINEAKDKLETYFDLALSMATIRQPDAESALQPAETHVNGFVPTKTEKSVNSRQVENIFDEEDDD